MLTIRYIIEPIFTPELTVITKIQMRWEPACTELACINMIVSRVEDEGKNEWIRLNLVRFEASTYIPFRPLS